MAEDVETCGDECPRLGGEQAISCTLPKGHAAHRNPKRGTVWEQLCDDIVPRTEAAEAAIEQVRMLAEQARGRGGRLCCCFDCEDAQEHGRDAPHEPTWTSWNLNPTEVLRLLEVDRGRTS